MDSIFFKQYRKYNIKISQFFISISRNKIILISDFNQFTFVYVTRDRIFVTSITEVVAHYW